MQRLADGLTAERIDALLRKWLARLPLYNARPQWLVDAHAALDAAVAAAYGRSADIADAAALRGLLELNGES